VPYREPNARRQSAAASSRTSSRTQTTPVPTVIRMDPYQVACGIRQAHKDGAASGNRHRVQVQAPSSVEWVLTGGKI
jgi:hypothetical protein